MNKVSKLRVLTTSVLFVLIFTTLAFPLAITSITITSVVPNPIPCGGTATVTVRIEYRYTPWEDLPQTGTVTIWEDDWIGDDKIATGTFTVTANDPQRGTKTVTLTIECEAQDAAGNCDFSGNAGTDDEHGVHSIYAKVNGKSTESAIVNVSCVKADGGIALVPPMTALTPGGGEGTMTLVLTDTILGVAGIDLAVKYDTTYFSVVNAQFDSSYFELFEERQVDTSINGLVWFYAFSENPDNLPPLLGSIDFASNLNTPFGSHLVYMDSTSALGDAAYDVLDLQLGSGHLAVAPEDTTAPVINTDLIAVNDSSVFGVSGSITDNFNTIPQYLEVSLLQEDSLDIGHTVVNNDGGFFIGEQSLTKGLPLKVVVRDGVGNTSDFAFIVTSISEKDFTDVIPESFTLHQNFPNPFNPSTTIRYELFKSGHVVLKVFNIKGQEIETLLDKEHLPGDYEVQFNSADLPSGIYYYQIQVEQFVERKKFVLLK